MLKKLFDLVVLGEVRCYLIFFLSVGIFQFVYTLREEERGLPGGGWGKVDFCAPSQNGSHQELRTVIIT